ncbi:MAG: acyltransferase [Rubrivivax sp.]|nr:MAG: acyltransferase [Rubrivivax sp.]
MSAPSHPPQPYFLGIDGLRAIAVLAVIAFHLNSQWLPGGFIGVDVFFVISGFVVTASVVNLRPAGLGSFVTYFYARRMVRILPALVACLLLSALASTLFIPQAWLSDSNHKSALAAFFGVSNFILAGSNGDYFSPKAEFNPFTHTWSLAVEEQFYLIFPPLLLSWLTARTPQRKTAITWTIGALAVASLLFCAWQTANQPTQAFYMLPARFWELSCGVLLMITLPIWSPRLAALPAVLFQLLSVVCLGGLAWGLFMAQESRFPFPWALLPVFTTAGLIALVCARPGSLLQRALTLKPVAYLGKASYSLYLWHWPVFVLFRWTVGLETLAHQASAALVTLLLAVLSYHLIEKPTRESRVARSSPRGRVVTAGLCVMVMGTLITAVCFKLKPELSLSVTSQATIWYPDRVDVNHAGQCELNVHVEPLSGGEIQVLRPVNCTTLPSPNRLFVAGDSHAWAYTSMLRRFAVDTGREVRIFTKGGCPIFNLRNTNTSGPAKCTEFAQAVVASLAKETKAGDTLFLPSLRLPRLRDQWGTVDGDLDKPNPSAKDEEQPSLIAAVELEAMNALKPLSDKGVHVAFEAPKPIFKAPPFRCSDWFNSSNPVCEDGFAMPKDQEIAMRQPVMKLMERITANLPGSSIWDPLPVLCPKSPCSSYQGKLPLFFDGDHLSGYGNTLLLPAFKRGLQNDS